MASPQRFNVAITRAMALLIVVGDPNALWADPSWRELLQYAVCAAGTLTRPFGEVGEV